MSVFKCKMCGGTVEFKPGATVGVCDSCGTKQTLPRLDDDRKANLYDRANHFRRNNDFDKAMGIYEQILNEDNTDAEAYWSLVLCRYGIEYVEDPATHKRVPTVNRAQYTSIFADEDYKSALQYADSYQKEIYEQEAKAIDGIQKGILEISSKEKPFDVFICYKETDAQGRRTQDSVLANDLYHQLTQESFKVFFSRITLEDKLGTAYEPYIFAALNSAKVMVVLGTKPEYFNAVWVKNEWSRYLSIVKQSGGKKVLIPAYRDMDPYDLPEEFSHLQAQDMSKLGFMQDLIRGIKKIVGTSNAKAVVKESVAVNTTNNSTAPLLRRAYLFLEDGNWQEADEYCERVLDLDPECAEAYVGKLMAELKVRKRDKLADCREPFESLNNCQKAIRFGDKRLIEEIEGYVRHIYERNENERLTTLYNEATDIMNRARTQSAFKDAAATFRLASGFKDADELAVICDDKAALAFKEELYNSALNRMKGKTVDGYEQAIGYFKQLSGWKDSEAQIAICENEIAEIEAKAKAEQEESRRRAEENRIKAEKRRKRVIAIGVPTGIVCITLFALMVFVIIPIQKFNRYMDLVSSRNFTEANKVWDDIADLGIVKEQENRVREKADEFLEKQEYDIAYDLFEKIGDSETARETRYLQANKLEESGEYQKAYEIFKSLSDYKDSELIKENILKKFSQKSAYTTISTNYSGEVGLKSDGTVIAVGNSNYGQYDVSFWSDIVSISSGELLTMGLKGDGTVVAAGLNDDGQCDLDGIKNVVAISAGSEHTVVLKADGTVVAKGYNVYGQCDVSFWEDIIAVSAGDYYTVGLKIDGTVVATGDNRYGQCDVDAWNDIVAISAGANHTLGLKSDGTVVATGDNVYGQCNVSLWNDIVSISAGEWNHSLGLKSDGTVVVAGVNMHGECDVEDWQNIVSISAGGLHSLGLKSDGTVIAVGEDDNGGQCDVSDWQDIRVPDFASKEQN